VLSQVITGAVAGAVGTVALNVSTYVDMALRGRPSSQTPQTTVDEGATRAGVDLSAGGLDEEQVSHRESGLGALMGYVTGVGVGIAFGMVRRRIPDLGTAPAGIGAGVAAMAASSVPMTLLGTTDPREWSGTSWAMDIVPHLAYGLTTAAVFDRYDGRAEG
jgi:hypothetical protein